MLQYYETLQDESGNALLGATVTVYAYPANSLAPIYQTNSTALPIAGSVVSADITGQVSFFAPDGLYNLVYSYNATIYKTKFQVSIFGIQPANNLLGFGATGNGITDDTSSVQAAFNSASAVGGGFSVYAPEGQYKCTSSLTLQAAISLQGVGCSPYVGSPAGAQMGPGTWFYFDHTAKGIIVQTAGDSADSGLEFRQFGTYRNQPVPGAGWTPNANDYDLWIENFGTYIDDVMFLNATAGVYFTSAAVGVLGSYAQLDIRRLRGQVFNDFIHLDTIYDVAKISQCHRWSFWADQANVHAYEQQFANFAFIARADNPQFTDNFAISCNAMFRFAQNTNGASTRGQFVNNGADSCVYGIYVDSSVTSGVLAQFENFYNLCPSTGYITGSNNILINGNDCILDIGKVELQGAQQNCVQVNGTGNTVTFGGVFRGVVYNQAAGGFNAVQVAAGNNVVLAMHPTIDASGPSKYGGAGNIWVDDWRPFSPVVTSGTGTITTLGTVTGTYKMHGQQIDYQFDISITTNGSAATDIVVSLPQAVANATYYGVGREVNLTGSQLNISCPTGSTVATVLTYNNGYPGGTGSRIIGNVSYQVAGL